VVPIGIVIPPLVEKHQVLLAMSWRFEEHLPPACEHWLRAHFPTLTVTDYAKIHVRNL